MNARVPESLKWANLDIPTIQKWAALLGYLRNFYCILMILNNLSQVILWTFSQGSLLYLSSPALIMRIIIFTLLGLWSKCCGNINYAHSTSSKVMYFVFDEISCCWPNTNKFWSFLNMSMLVAFLDGEILHRVVDLLS